MLAGSPYIDKYNLQSLMENINSKQVERISSNYGMTACVTRAGELYTWGLMDRDRLGHGDGNDRLMPKCVNALRGVKVKEVACGYFHTVVCTEDGEVFTFGVGACGQLGHGEKQNSETFPALVQALKGKHITQVQCGEFHTMALTSSGYVFTWGHVADGRLGHGKLDLQCLSIPCLVEGLRDHNVVRITTLHAHCAALVDYSPSSIRQSQKLFFNNKEQSNVVFMVENEPLYANVGALSQKSDYFAAIFRCNTSKSKERIFQVSDCSKAAFLQVLQYLCLDDFVVNLDHVVELWGLAVMYQLVGLLKCCIGALEKGLSEKNVFQILRKAKRLNCDCDDLRMMCRDYMHRDY